MKLITASSLKVGDVIHYADSPDRLITDIYKIGEVQKPTYVIETVEAKPYKKYAGPTEQFVVLENKDD